MQLTIKLLSLLRQKQDTYTYEYFHEPPVIPLKLKGGRSESFMERKNLFMECISHQQAKQK